MRRLDFLSADDVRARLDYDPKTGVFLWKYRQDLVGPARAWNSRYAGRVAGNSSGKCGHVRITINSTSYLAQRLAWIIMTGQWPVHQVDHRDLNPQNNAFCNLRQATGSQNQGNKGLQRNNSSGHKGVYFHTPSKKYRAVIKVSGKLKNIGSYATPEEAAAAYKRVALESFGEFMRTE